jgi:hypothetical protein
MRPNSPLQHGNSSSNFTTWPARDCHLVPVKYSITWYTPAVHKATENIKKKHKENWIRDQGSGIRDQTWSLRIRVSVTVVAIAISASQHLCLHIFSSRTLLYLVRGDHSSQTPCKVSDCVSPKDALYRVPQVHVLGLWKLFLIFWFQSNGIFQVRSQHQYKEDVEKVPSKNVHVDYTWQASGISDVHGGSVWFILVQFTTASSTMDLIRNFMQYINWSL